MVTKQQKAASARARAARHCATTQAISNPTNVCVAIETDSECEQGCGYMGGMNHQFSDTGYDSGTESEWLGASGSGSSVVELEGDELEENLRELRKEAHAIVLEAFPKYGQEISF
ncbi:hypothetical protein M405DRAFT_831738 [Rhizopogon salebrosus TDB-379]|nr:hypothetical protein M405DRAFT_831738 [Rhizopogon salebrosus TDB-379]